MMEKLCQTARRIDFALKILFWVIVVLGGLILCGSVAAALLPHTGAIEGFQYSLHGVKLQPEDIAQFPALVWMTFVIIAVGLVLWCIGIVLLRKILRPMQQGLPFVPSVAQGFLRLGRLSLIYLVYDALSNMFTQAVTMRYGLQQGGEVTALFQFNLGYALLAALLFLCAYIFRYGTELQRLSDETL